MNLRALRSSFFAGPTEDEAFSALSDTGVAEQDFDEALVSLIRI